jgi:hypothetical protein
MLKKLLENTRVGLITYTNRAIKVIKKADKANPKRSKKLYDLLSSPYKYPGVYERDDYIERVFETLKNVPERKGFGRWQAIVMINSVLNLMEKKGLKKLLEEWKRFTDYPWYKEDYKKFIEIIKKLDEMWFPRANVNKEAKNFCKKFGKSLSNLSETAFRWGIERARLAGFLEARSCEGGKICFRITPIFIPKLYELVQRWRKSI